VGGQAGIQRLSEEFADQTLRALNQAKRLDPIWSIKRTVVDLGKPGFNLKACATGKKIRKFLNYGMVVSLGTALPSKASLWALDLGNIRMLSWPGEPTTALGTALKEIAVQNNSGVQPWILGLTNGYLAYFVTPEEFKEGGYESCSSLYGPDAGKKILRGYGKLLAQ
jgi:hypothetical protein